MKTLMLILSTSLLFGIMSCKKSDIYPTSGRVDLITWKNQTHKTVYISIYNLPSIKELTPGAIVSHSSYDNDIYMMERPFIAEDSVGNVIMKSFVEATNIIE